MMKTTLVLFLAMAAVRAQSNPQVRKQSPTARALDADRDGVISAAEIQNAPEALKSLDLDGDGKITSLEWRPGGDPRIAESAQVVKWVMAMDANGDGKISASELPDRMKNMMARADQNHDGFLTPEEIRAQAFADADVPVEPRPDLVTAALDSDHDGTISAEEIANAPGALLTLDKNSDGQLSEDEMKPPPKPAASSPTEIKPGIKP